MRIAVLNGVNLNMLGERDPEHYGTLTLPELDGFVRERAAELGIEVEFSQTNFEGEYVELIQRARGSVDGLILNAGAWTHYAWALHDALEAAAVPAVEVHLSNVLAREAWRRESVIAPLCIASIAGRGPDGYADALVILRDHLTGGAT
jgi:3-dehydroquinate dehydratase-2